MTKMTASLMIMTKVAFTILFKTQNLMIIYSLMLISERTRNHQAIVRMTFMSIGNLAALGSLRCR